MAQQARDPVLSLWLCGFDPSPAQCLRTWCCHSCGYITAANQIRSLAKKLPYAAGSVKNEEKKNWKCA